MQFDSPDDELQFLRARQRLADLADAILEDCLERRMGLSAALDVFLSQCAQMIHAQSGFVTLFGTHGPVLIRMLGIVPVDLELAAQWEGAVVAGEESTLFVSPLTLGKTKLGALGFVLRGRFEGGGKKVMPLVEAVAEQLDSALLAFLTLSDGFSPLQRLDQLSEATAFNPNGRIGRYELVTPLGTGGMAQVMVARAVGPGGVSRLVALKRILPSLTGDSAMLEQFLDEARVGMRLSHPNLVTFYEFGEAAGVYYMAMELVRGVELDPLIYAPHGPLPPDLAVAVARQLLEGLHAAHEARGEDGALLGLVHRDLSPQNVMVGFDGRVKLLDFGVAKARKQRTVTVPGIVKGKPLYMSPEQAVGDRLDRRSDLFSVGLILYESLTGTRAFERSEDSQTMIAIVRDPTPDHPRIPSRLKPILDLALKKSVQERYQTARAFAAALTEAYQPASDQELGRVVRATFPGRLREMAQWERAEQDETDSGVANAPTRVRSL